MDKPWMDPAAWISPSLTPFLPPGAILHFLPGAKDIIIQHKANDPMDHLSSPDFHATYCLTQYHPLGASPWGLNRTELI